MNRYYESNLPGAPQQVIALPIPARLIETFSKSGIVFAPTPQGEAMSELFYFFWSAIVHFFMQRKRTNPVDGAINEAARAAAAGALAVPGQLAAAVAPVANMVDAANPPAAGGGAFDVNEEGKQTHFEFNGARYPYIALFWETMHGGNSAKPIGYVVWIASWAENGLSKLISTHLKRCVTFKNDLKLRPPCSPSHYAINDPVLLIKRIDDVFSESGQRECLSYLDFRDFKTHAKHPVQFFDPQRLSIFFPNGWSVNAGRAPSIEAPTLPWFVQFVPYHVISSRYCTWDFPLYCLARDIAEVLCNTGGVVTDGARVSIEDVIERAVRESTINATTTRSDYFYEASRDLLAYLRERNVVDDDATEEERRASGARIFEQMPSMMTLPGESNGFVGNVSSGQYAVFSTMGRVQLPVPAVRLAAQAGGRADENGDLQNTGNGRAPEAAQAEVSQWKGRSLFEMVTRDLSPASNVLLKIISMFHDLMGVHYGNRMCMTMSCFVNNLGCARPYVGTGLMPCIGLFGPKALGKNRAHDAAAAVMNKRVILPFASLTPAVFRTNSVLDGMLMAVLETPKELLGIDATGQAAPTPLSEMFKELLTSGGEIKSFNYNGGTRDQNLRTTTVSSFRASIAMRLICNHRRETFEKMPIGSRIMMLENQNFADAIDAQSADSFVDEHSGDAIESTLSVDGREWVERMRTLFDVFYVYCAFQRMGQLPLLPEEPVRMVLDGMNERLRERGYDGYTMRVGTQITNEVRALSTFLNIALWWEGGLGAAYRAATNTAMLNFDVLLEISRYQRVLEDAIVFVFTQNISLVQSPLRQAVSDELRAMFKGAAAGAWNEALVSDRVAPNPVVHGEESVADQRMRENYVQLNVSIVELRKLLAARLKISTEEIATALNQIREHEQCVVDGMPQPVYRVRGAYTDQRGFFLKRWIVGGSAKGKRKHADNVRSGSIYSEFLDMLYKSMSLDRTVPTACVTSFPSEVDGESIGLGGNVHVLGVPARVCLEQRRHEFKTFTRPARSFYFCTGGKMSRHRTTDGEWVQRGFPAAIRVEDRAVIDFEMLRLAGNAPTVLHEYPRAGIEHALLERKEQIVARDLRKYLPRVMPHYSALSDLWMPVSACASATLSAAPSGSHEDEPEEREAHKEAVVRAYQKARTTHQSSAYGLYCFATACRRWCEAVLDASFETAGTLERYIEALRGETSFAVLKRSFDELVVAQREVHAVLTAASAAELEGIELRAGTASKGFASLIETLPVLSKRERAYMEMYAQYVDLRPIGDTCEFIRPNYQATEACDHERDVSSITAAFEMLKARAIDVREKFARKEPAARRGVDHPCSTASLTHVLRQRNVSLPHATRTVIENVNLARREALACIACGDFASACAVDECAEAALSQLVGLIKAAPAELRAEALAEAARVSVNFSGKVQAAWGSAALTALMPLSEKLPAVRFDASLWAAAGEVREALNDEPVRSAAAINRLELLSACQVTGKRAASSAGAASKHARLDGNESDDEAPMLSLQATLEPPEANEFDDAYAAMNPPVAWDAQRAWVAAFMYHRDLPLPSLPPVSSAMRSAIAAGVDRQAAPAPTSPIGAGLIVTPQSMSALLFRD